MQPVIIVRDLKQGFRQEKVLEGITFEVQPGESFGIFGMRGTGKSTLLHILAGIDRFKYGQVEIMGCDIRKSDKFKQELGIVTQKSSLFQDLTVGENLDFIGVLKKASPQSVSEVIESLQLSEYLNKPITGLDSGGVFQRLSLACALLNKPKLLILDELIKDIDLYSRNLILRELFRFQSGGGTSIFGFSDIEFCKYLHQVGWLDNGQMTIYSPTAAQDEWERQSEFYLKQSDNHAK